MKMYWKGVELIGYLVHVVGGYMRTVLKAVWQTGMKMSIIVRFVSIFCLCMYEFVNNY